MTTALGQPSQPDDASPAVNNQTSSPDAKRPYSADSAWNLKIGPDPAYDPNSEIYVNAIEGLFGADPSMYAMPVYIVDEQTPLRDVIVSDWWSNVVEGGTKLIRERRVTVQIPIPDGAQSSAGKDASIVFWNPRTGEEWGFWQASAMPSGDWMARNGYAYNTNWNGVPPEGFVSRGAGLPYLAGCLRPWELRQGRIEHALAFAVNYPSDHFIYPATKSDGSGLPPALPEGARLQLNPALTDADFEAWGLSREGKIIARALQEYGMILTDGGGHPKLYIEDNVTADWGPLLDKDIVRNIPYDAFSVLDLRAPARPPAPEDPEVTWLNRTVVLEWEPVEQATRYWILRRTFPHKVASILDSWITEPRYRDADVSHGAHYEYAIVAVNHNGISVPSTIAAIATPND